MILFRLKSSSNFQCHQKYKNNTFNAVFSAGIGLLVFKCLFVIAIGLFVYLDSVLQNGFSNENGIVGKGNRNQNTELALTPSLKSDMKMYSRDIL